MTDMRLAIAGAGGRMGRTLTRIVHETAGCEVAGGLEPKGSPLIGQDMGQLAGIGDLGITIGDSMIELALEIDGIIDFTVPAASVAISEIAAQARISHIIGTTGFSKDQEKAIEAAARHARIVKSGNMSLGVNLLASMIKRVASILNDDFDIEVVEMHHRHKIDAPSGTALLLGQAAADGRDVDLDEKAVKSRVGHTGERTPGDIGFAALRGGSVVGDHTVIFAGPDERIEFGHRAQSRDIFANGAVKAAIWSRDQNSGLYDMNDVLGL